MISLEGLVAGIGCGVLSEGKAEGIDFDWRRKGSARALADWWGLWSWRLFVVWVEVHDGRKKNLPTQKLPNIQHEQANRHALGGRAAPHVSVAPRVFGKA